MADRLHDFVCQIKFETAKAWLVTSDGEDEIWLPKSNCELEKNRDGRTWTATIPEWLAMEKNLI